MNESNFWILLGMIVFVVVVLFALDWTDVQQANRIIEYVCATNADPAACEEKLR